MISVAKRMDSVNEYFFSTKLKEIARLRRQGKNIINLGIGSPDLRPTQKAVKQLIKESKDKNNHAYQSYTGIPELRKAFAKWYRRFFDVELNYEDEILPLAGSKEGVMHISMTYLEKGDKVLIPNPGYAAYRATALLAGASVVEYPPSEKNNWLIDFDKLEKRNLTKVKIMWVNYPNMPTGAPGNKAFFERLIAFGEKHKILIVNDNPYSFILNDQPLSLLSVDGAKEVALELNSLSKSHNMAGWRLGMVAGNAKYLRQILKFKSNMDSGMFKPVQLAAVQALKQPGKWYKELNKKYRRRKQKVMKLLDLLQCRYDKNLTGMFIWAKIPKGYKDGYAFSDKILYEYGIFITPGGIFGSQGTKYIRISLSNKTALVEKAIDRLTKQ